MSASFSRCLQLEQSLTEVLIKGFAEGCMVQACLEKSVRTRYALSQLASSLGLLEGPAGQMLTRCPQALMPQRMSWTLA